MTATLLDQPAWVLQPMHAAGLPERRSARTPTTHRREKAAGRWCRCGQPVWTGLCDRIDVALDAAPTTPDGELYAILTGRRTFEIDYHGVIDRRRPAHIRARTADTIRVFVAHECAGPAPPINTRWAPPSKSDSDIPPF